MADWVLWLIPGAPLTAAILLACSRHSWYRDVSHLVCIVGIGIAAVLSLALVFVGGVETLPRHISGFEWISIGDISINVVLYADVLSTMMLAMVTSVALLVAVFAAGYMHGDAGQPRFFAEVSLFVFSMSMLVLSGNLILLYVFWEAVGLCSYLLIGYWYQKPAAAAAAKKAFLVNRIGDLGFALGIFVMWLLVGEALNWNPPAGRQLLDYTTVFSAIEEIAQTRPTLLLTASLLLFAGAVGKSAQFPLHVWLPDAMEGPTPVSALIHAATMVTAGVYMIARLSPMMLHVPEAQAAVAIIGGVTALMAAFIALTQHDLKRVLAYSTVSQLGLMFVALGCACGDVHRLAIAVIAGMFHLFTHAFFKALLFLGSGSVMHSMGNVIDMRRFSGLRHVMPITHWTFLVGALALAGIPPLSGFWSKDEILAVAGMAVEQSPYPNLFFLLHKSVLLTSGLTAFYIFRAYFRTFWGPLRLPKEAGLHPHESPQVMTWPLTILAVCSAIIGLLLGPTHSFFNYLSHATGLTGAEPHPLSLDVAALGTLVGLGGILAAWWMYVARPKSAESWAKRSLGLYRLSVRKLFLDELYAVILVRPLEAVAAGFGRFDKSTIDRCVDWLGEWPTALGRWLRDWQSGLIQSYAAMMFVGLTLMAAYLLLASQ
jgi:NADH-quinone oxidoreductase subunit L